MSKTEQYVSRRYLREKWDNLKWDMEKVIGVYDDGDDLLKALKYAVKKLKAEPQMVSFREGDKRLYVDPDYLVELYRMVRRDEIVRVIRCKDCKWIDLCKDPEHYEYKGANGFCSKGERKQEVDE